MDNRLCYSGSSAAVDILLALIQAGDTAINIIYFLNFPFQYVTLYYLSFSFLCLNILTQYIYSNLRLCTNGRCFKLFNCFKSHGLFYEKIKISDCGYFSQINAHSSDAALCFLYLFAPVVLAYLFVSLLINMTYVIINWLLSLIIFLLSSIAITFIATIFCWLKMDLFLYPACVEVSGFFYFVGDKNSKKTNEKMLLTKKFCILFHILFQTIPLLVVYIVNNIKMKYFEESSQWTRIIIYLQIGLSATSIFLTIYHIISLSKYGKLGKVDYEKVLRQNTVQHPPNSYIYSNQNIAWNEISKKNTEVIIVESLDAIPNKK